MSTKRETLIVLFALMLALGFSLLTATPAHAVTVTSAGSGNWNVGGTWVGGAVPGTTDDVVIANGHTVTLTANAQCGSLTFNLPGNSKTSTLAVGTWTFTTGSISLTGGAGGTGQITVVTISTGTINCTGAISFSGTAASARLTFSGAGTLNIGGNLGTGGTFTASTGTVNCNGSSAQTVAGYTYNVLKSNNTAGVTLVAATTITTLTIGDVTSNSIFNDGGFVITPGASSVLNLTSGTYNLGSATVGTAWPAWATRNITAGTTVGYVSAVAQAVSITPSYPNLTFSGAGAKTPAAGTLTVGGNLIVSAGTLALNTNNNPVSVAGNITNNGTITPGTSNVTLNGTGAQSISGTTTPTTFGTLTINKASGTATLGVNITMAADLTVTAGTLDLSSYTANRTAGGGTLTVSNGATLKIGGTNTMPSNYTTHTFGATSTIEYNGSTQTVSSGETYGNLTINQSSGNATLGGAATVNGTLTLTAGNLAVTDPNVLTMGASATTTGATDVTGIVKRTTLVAATSYTFGNQYTTVTFQNVGTLPTDMSVKITIGSAPAWKTGAILRTYDFIRTGASGSFATVNLHYLDAELNGNTENTTVLWDGHLPSPPGDVDEHGRSNYDTTNNWVGLSSMSVTYFAKAAFGSRIWTLGNSILSNATWNGSISTVWTDEDNWTPTGVPSDLVDVIIPDAATTPNDPTLGTTLLVGRLTINNGGILNSADSSTVTISGGSGAWSNNGGTFNAGTGMVIFTNAAATMSGTTDFYNVTINSGAGLQLGSSSVMRIGGTITNNGVWDAGELWYSTVEYNGGSQTVLNPNGVTPRYHYLILSGSGTKTMPGTALSIHDDFSMSGTASATAGAAMSIAGSFTVGPGTSFTTGAYTHTIGGDFSNSGTFTATGSTITLNGTAAQAIGGTTTTAFNNLTIANTNAAVSANTNFSVVGTLTVDASAVLNPAATVVISGAGTLTGNGTVNVTRTLATADFSSQYTISTKTLTNLTVAYAGGAAQTVSALTYGGLKINNSNGVTLGGNATVNGTLTLTSGKITTDANTVIISSSGSVSGGSSSSYVYGNLQKYVPTGAQSPTFEVGTASYYNPVTIAFNNVSVAGNLTAKVTSEEHPNIASSTIKSSKNVNAYWTLTKDGTLAFNNYGATFTFVSGDVDSGANTDIFIVGRYSGGWTYPTIGTRTPTSTQATGVTSLSDFTIGDSWESYNDAAHQNQDDLFNQASEDTVYMYGEEFEASTAYHVAYYDHNDTKLKSDGVSSTPGGTLSSQCYFPTYQGSAVAGTWHAVVYKDTVTSPPETYVASDPNSVVEDSFEVTEEAIPEFPTVIAGTAVAGMCFGIYWWMRKRIAVSRQSR